jgi:tellurite resistance protein
MHKAISVQTALVYVMVVVSASDARMTDDELHSMGDFVRGLPIFDGFGEEAIIPAARECGHILQETGGLDHILSMVTDALSPGLRETAFLIALEVAMADAPIMPEENRILQRLRQVFGLDPLVAAALTRAAHARLVRP